MATISHSESFSSDEPNQADLVQAWLEAYPELVESDEAVTETNFQNLINAMVLERVLVPVQDVAFAGWKQEIGAAVLPYGARYLALDDTGKDAVLAAFAAAIDEELTP